METNRLYDYLSYTLRNFSLELILDEFYTSGEWFICSTILASPFLHLNDSICFLHMSAERVPLITTMHKPP